MVHCWLPLVALWVRKLRPSRVFLGKCNQCWGIIFLQTLCLLLALNGCAGDAWDVVVGGEDLITDPSWTCSGWFEVEDGDVIVASGDDYRAVTNLYGPRLVAGGDFAVVVEMSLGRQEPAGSDGIMAAFSLVGQPGLSDWWGGTRRLDVGIEREGERAAVVVRYYDGASFMPRLAESFPVDDLPVRVELALRRLDTTFVILAEGQEIGQVEDPGLFADSASGAYVGASLRPHTVLTLHRITVEAPPGEDAPGVALVAPDGVSAYVPTEPPLRALATAQGVAIGAAVNPVPLRCTETYGHVLGREFNILTTENALKFGPVHPEPDRYDFADADAIVDFAGAHAMQVRGHALVWHQAVPAWIETATFDQPAWEAVLQEHITTVVGRYKGRVQVWDVVNEAIGESGTGELRQTLWLAGVGPDYIDKAFRWAHEADPDALLFYNDYGAEGMGGKSQQVYDLVAGMVERGVPIHGVGLQMHLAFGVVPDLEDVRANMERLGALGLQVHITELDVRLPADPWSGLYERQVEIYRDLMDVCLSVDACTAYVMWGFTDRYSWIPAFYPGMGEALIFDADYRPKLAYEALWEVLAPVDSRGPSDPPRALGPADFGAECDCVP